MWKKSIQNLHVHTRFCDGQDTPEELVRHALALGMDGIGFSAHSSTEPFSPEGCLSLQREPAYKAEINRLKDIYGDRLRIFLGLEYEMYSSCDPTGYDYMIGACHFLRIGDAIVSYDEGSPESMRRVIDTYYGGDGVKMAEQYYEDFTKITDYQKIDIIGHFDAIRLYCDRYHVFDDTCSRYKTAAIESLRTLVKKVPVFELNTSILASHPAGMPFPAPFLLKELKSQGGHVVITTDCHTKKYMLLEYERAVGILRSCGFNEFHIKTDKGFEGVKI